MPRGFLHCLLNIYQKYKRFTAHISKVLFYMVLMQEGITPLTQMSISCYWWIWRWKKWMFPWMLYQN